MRYLLLLPVILFSALATSFSADAQPSQQPQGKQLPSTLETWRDWALWDVNSAPPFFNNAGTRPKAWPSRLNVTADALEGRFDFSAQVYREAWLALPGSPEVWPAEVLANGIAVPVVPREGRPAVFLAPGLWTISGKFFWSTLPQQLQIPREIGLLALTVSGAPVAFPVWEADGLLWLRRDRIGEEAEADFLSLKVYRLLEDGVPLWLRTEVEVTVSGKSREVELGTALPEGWQLSAVNSPIPVMVDEAGQMKAQVRAGRWTIRLDAFRLQSPAEIRFAAGVKPLSEEELIGFSAKPDFRSLEITGVPAVDVSQTTYPDAWRSMPVYLWNTAQAIGLTERQRGMGIQQAPGLTIRRTLWLDESGKALTFSDRLSGTRQEIWRLDVAPGNQLGSVRSGEASQLITRNPKTGDAGVEVRSRDVSLQATGRVDVASALSATGWKTDADGLNITMQLPPGWRMFAVFGADSVDGDWLTAWSLLDLFLLLIFSLAVFRLWGFLPGVLAFFAFGLAYHEAGAPRFIWLALLIPVALLRVVPQGWGHRLITAWKWISVLVLILVLVPFLSQQVQQLLYPQLEQVRGRVFDFEAQSLDEVSDRKAPTARAPASEAEGKDKQELMFEGGSSLGYASSKRQVDLQVSSNLMYSAGEKIQTGPAIPAWSWRVVSVNWNGPVSQTQEFRPILISMSLERVLTALRMLLLIALAAVLLGNHRGRSRRGGPPPIPAAAMLALLFAWAVPSASAQFPSQELLNTLRDRLVEVPDVFPTAADISLATLTIEGDRVQIVSQIHTAVECAVPLPGRLSGWAPLAISVDGKPVAAIRRQDGSLWIVLPKGVHQVEVTGALPSATEWEWTFALKPRRVVVTAPDWNVSGIDVNGVPESQVFLVRKEKSGAAGAGYDRQDLRSVALVDRQIELGLVWQVRTVVRRLSPPGKAVELRIPLLPGERVLSADLIAEGNVAQVRFGAGDSEVAWSSELSRADSIALTSSSSDPWVERWSLTASAVWNVGYEGIAPVFDASNPNLIPNWTPWPGESVTLEISRPEAIPGATVTIDRVENSMEIGSRQRTSTLTLGVRSSLGEDFSIGLPAGAEVSSLDVGGRTVPVRMDGDQLILALRPGQQDVSVNWRRNVDAGNWVRAEAVALPVESANVQTSMSVGADRWILWTDGPQRGPAVRFWMVLICALAAGWALGRVPLSPLKSYQWMLLALGLTQVPLLPALIVSGWFFILAARGRSEFRSLSAVFSNLIQVIVIVWTVVVLGIFIWVVAEGLLGSPEMFILGNGSSVTELRWLLDRSGTLLPQPGYFSVSIWFYRLAMLLWALWLAASLLGWLTWAWARFSDGGVFRLRRKKPEAGSAG